jgi:pilus assembly protein TadC
MKSAPFPIKAYRNFVTAQITMASGFADFGPLEMRSVRQVTFLQIGLALAGAAIVKLSGAANGRTWLYFVALALGILAPIKRLKSAAKRRRQLILWELPGLMEIVAMIMEAGQGFDAAIRYVADHKKGYVAALFRRVRQEIDAGAKREAAYRKIAKSGSIELSMFLDLVIKAEEQGRPVKTLVLELARSYRERQKNALEEAAGRLSTTMLIPIFICIVPPMILLYLLPALVNLGALYG